MGRRGRVVLRRIEDRVRRGICFRKRLAGLEKKVEELAVLCDAHVGFVVLSCSGDDANPHHFAAPATIENIVERYEHSQAAQKGVHGRCILQKVVADRIARLQKKVQKKPATAETESNSTEMPSDHEKVAGGSQQSAEEEEEEMEVVLRHRLSLGTGDRDDGGGGAAEQRHRTTPPPAVDLNVPCRDAGQLQ
nr:MADS-box transcription factor 33-like isoform X4 [Oryza sativa Japonica Group]